MSTHPPIKALSRASRWLGLLLALGLVACGEPPTQLANGTPAPAFSARDLDGRLVRFPEDLTGQIVALRFWADWCPFCGPEMRDIEPSYQAYRDQGLRVLAVNVRQSPSTAARFIERLGISYEVLLDEDGELARRFGVTGLPTTYFIDREGRLVTRILGETAPGLFATIVSDLL